jgi:hypothetical protein
MLGAARSQFRHNSEIAILGHFPIFVRTISIAALVAYSLILPLKPLNAACQSNIAVRVDVKKDGPAQQKTCQATPDNKNSISVSKKEEDNSSNGTSALATKLPGTLSEHDDIDADLDNSGKGSDIASTRSVPGAKPQLQCKPTSGTTSDTAQSTVSAQQGHR